jgi:hypothetical protein
LFLSLLLAPRCSWAQTEIAFVVNSANKASELSTTEIADFYFKRRLRWPNGTKVHFIDQRDSSPRKELFLKLIEKSQREIELFWIGEKNFSGSSAPLQAPSDTMVLSMVASLPGGIGYVSAERSESSGVKQIVVKKGE